MVKTYSTWESAKWMFRRFLRTFLPQLPALFAVMDTVLPPEMAPYLVVLGSVVTVLDKVLRDMGAYDNIPLIN